MTALKPAGAKVGEWQDVDTPNAYRTVSKRHYYGTENYAHYVEACAMQNPDGSLDELAVRAELEVWQHHVHHHWDDALTPVEARLVAARLSTAADELRQLSLMFEVAADDVEKWGQAAGGAR